MNTPIKFSKKTATKNSHRVENQLKKLAPKKGDKVLHFETLSGEDVKAALTELGAKGKTSLPAPKPAASSDEKTLAKINRVAQNVPRAPQV
jgi:hypothetical protein